MEPPPPPRWIVGIDLGTTNSAVAYVDTALQTPVVNSFLIEQLTDWNTSEKRKTLPSFHYVPTNEEANSCPSKWLSKAGKSHFIVGSAARDLGGNAPDRQITSAKSWLCHRTADRTAPILPWHGDPEIDLISPVVASSRYLEHIRIAWDAAHPEHPLESCEVILTLPASFDEVARELTLQAAKMAGLPNIVLIEEPQAAFYAWLESQEADTWQDTIKPGNTVLVCDIGGGTTDFTLIRVKAETSPTESLQKYGLHRVAVGQHLILGGDNLDVALSKVIEPMLTGSENQTLPIRQWEQLRHQCRMLKERLLQSDAPESSSVAIVGTGSRLISNTRSAKIDKALVERTVLEGFFPKVALSDKPQQLDSGLVEFGLTYATEPAITKHLASFLWEHRWDGRDDTDRQTKSDLQAAKPDWLLFNGGVLESSLIRDRLEEQVNDWFPEEKPVGILPAERLDLAVSIGAAYFGLAKRGLGVRITANLARSYYLKISEAPPRVVCIMSANAKPLDSFQLNECPLTLTVGQPIQLPIFVSNTNLIHRVGAIVGIEPTVMLPLAPLATVLQLEKSRKTRDIPVYIESSLSEIGTLELALVEAKLEPANVEPSRWKLAFDLRGMSADNSYKQTSELSENSSPYAIIDQATITQVTSIVRQAFSTESGSLSKSFMKQIAELLDLPREEWSLSVLRAIWQACLECDQDRKKSPAIESRWLNTIGFCLRPGYGFVSDDWRVAQTWRAVRGKLRYPSSAAEAMILWRRVSGGFTQGQQQAIYQEMQTNLRGILSGDASKIRLVSDPEEFLRMVGSLELLPSLEKSSIGRLAIDSLENVKLKSFQEGILWMIGRLGSRSQVYAPVNRVLAAETAEQWLTTLMRKKELPILALQRAVFSLARKTNDRYRDISREQQTKVLDWLDETSAPLAYVELVKSAGNLAASEQEAFAGDSLPLGVRLSD